jgi:hypothetical protein
MKFAHIVKGAAALVLAGALTGCFDVDMDVKVTDVDHVAVTIATSISKEMADMAQMESGDSEFCDEAGVVTETETAIVCTETKEGTFAEAFPASEDGEPQPTIAVVGPRLVKVTFPTADISGAFGGAETDDPQAKEMMLQMFKGHAMTLRVSGGTITDTNMTKAADGQSAEIVIALDDVVSGTADIPAEAYAVVQLP